MRLIVRGILALLALAVLLICLANREMATLALGPDLSAYGVPAAPSVTLPLFLIVLLAGAIGFIFGAGREYLRESRHRRAASDRREEVQALQRENAKLKRERPGDEDDEIIEALAR